MTPWTAFCHVAVGFPLIGADPEQTLFAKTKAKPLNGGASAGFSLGSYDKNVFAFTKASAILRSPLEPLPALSEYPLAKHFGSWGIIRGNLAKKAQAESHLLDRSCFGIPHFLF